MKTAVVMLVVALSHCVASAQTQKQIPKSGLSTRIADEVTRRSGFAQLGDCLGQIRRIDNSFVVEMRDGVTMEFTQGKAGEPQKVIVREASGATSAIVTDVPDFQADRNVPSVVARDDSYKALKDKVRAALGRAMHAECAMFSLSKTQKNPNSGQVSKDMPSVVYTPGDSYRPWEADDFYAFADVVVSEDFANVSDYFLAEASGGSLMQCSEAIAQCRDACNSVQALETSGCAALGIAAGAFLSPGVGAAVTFYCSGRVFVGAAKCRESCNSTHIPCR